MSLDRALWLSSIIDSTAPAWPCPECGFGPLVVVADSFRQEENKEVVDIRKAGGTPDLGTYGGIFCGMLQCERATCRAFVAVSGTSFVLETPTEPSELVHGYEPKMLWPSPPLFTPPKGTSEDVLVELRRAWALYWADPDSCGNRVRTCVELLLTYLGVPQKTRSSKRMRRLSLHDVTTGLGGSHFHRFHRDPGPRAGKWISRPRELTLTVGGRS